MLFCNNYVALLMRKKKSCEKKICLWIKFVDHDEKIKNLGSFADLLLFSFFVSTEFPVYIWNLESMNKKYGYKKNKIKKYL